MGNVTITGTITDQTGASGNFSTIVTLNSKLMVTAVVTPSNAPVGTARNITVTVAGGSSPYTYNTPLLSGKIFTPVAYKPGQWTFVL